MKMKNTTAAMATAASLAGIATIENMIVDGPDVSEIERIRACIEAGVDEPDRSLVGSSWKSVGFYKNSTWRVFSVEWRR